MAGLMVGIVLLVAQLTAAAGAAGGAGAGAPVPAAAASSAPAVARTEPQITATSRVITISLKATVVQVEEVLAGLFERAGQSYVFVPGPASGPSRRSREVTVSFKDVEFEKAVALLCDAAGLQCEHKEGGWVISERSDVVSVGGLRIPVVGAMGMGGAYPWSTLSAEPKHPTFPGEDRLIDLDVKDMLLAEVAAKLSYTVTPPKAGEVLEGEGYGEAMRGKYDSVEIVVDDSVKDLKVTARIRRWPLGKVLDMLLDQANLACSLDQVVTGPIATKEGHAQFKVRTYRLYLVPRPELTVSGGKLPLPGTTPTWLPTGTIGFGAAGGR
jgi:hypothetical protein